MIPTFVEVAGVLAVYMNIMVMEEILFSGIVRDEA